MPSYATGRVVSVVFEDRSTSGNWALRMQNGLDSGLDDFPLSAGQVYGRFPWYDPFSDTGWFSWQSGGYDPDPPNPVPDDYDQFPYGSNVTMVAGPGNTVGVVAVNDGIATIPVGHHLDVTGSWTGSMTCTVVCDEYAFFDYLTSSESVYYPDPSDPSALPFPVTGGNAMPDGIPARKCAVYLVPRVGQTVTATATVNGASLTQTFTWLDTMPERIYHGLYHVLATGSHLVPASCTADPYVSGVQLFHQAVYDYSNGANDYSATGSLSLASDEDFGELIADGEIPTVYRFHAKYVGGDGAEWPNALTLNYTGGSHAVTGTGTWDVEQKSWYAQAYRGSTLLSSDGVSDEKGYVSAALSQGSLASSSLDKRDWRQEFLTWRCAGITLAHASSHTVSGTWSGTTAGGIGQVLSSGSATLALTGDDRLLGGYRYLEIQLKPVGFGSRDVTVTLTNADITKTYKVTLGADGSTAYYRIDTASPMNVPANGSPTDRNNRYPLRPQPSHADSPIASEPDDDVSWLEPGVTPGEDATDADVLERQRTWIWGATDATSVSVSCTLGDGETLQIGAVRLVRVGSPTMTLSEGFCGQTKVTQDRADCFELWPLTAAGGRTTIVGSVWGAPFFYAFVDGRLVYDLPSCGYRQFVVGGYEWAFDSASTVAGNLNRYPGWTCGDSSPTPNFYGLGTSSQFSGSLLGGGGIDFDGSTFTVHVNQSLGSLIIQDRYDWLQSWPGSGSPFGWGDATLGQPCPLAVAKILGNVSHGFVFQDDTSATPGAPFEGAIVKDYRDDLGTDTQYAAGTTNANGSFKTVPSSGPIGGVTVPTDYLAGGNQLVKTRLINGSNPEDLGYARARQILRTGFRGVAEEQGRVLALISRADGRLFRITSTDTATKFGRSSTRTYTAWESSDVHGPADDGDLAKAHGGHVVVLLVVSGTAYLALVKDQGAAPLTTMTEGSATAGCLVSRGEGLVYSYRIDGGTLKGTLRNTKDLSIVDGPWSTNLTGLSSSARVDADPVSLPGNAPGIVLSIYDGTLSTYLSTNGKTFS